MTRTAYQLIVDTLRDRGSTVKDDGSKATAQCAAHDDGRASLSVAVGRTGDRAVVHCHAGCQTNDVLAALGLEPKDLFDEQATYTYPGGAVVHRHPGKGFHQGGKHKTDRSLFRSDELPENHSTPVYVVEGEKDVNTTKYLDGVHAVSPRQGASTDPSRYDWSVLKGRPVVIVADRDDAGREHAAKVAALLGNVAKSVQIVEAAEGKDFTDHVQNGHGVAELVPVTAAGPPPAAAAVSARSDEDKPARRSVAAQLVDLARGDYVLGVTETDDPFGVSKDRRHVALMLRGGRTGLRAELSRRFFELHDTVPAQQALADACCVLEGFAAQQHPRRVYLRVAEATGAVYIDMGDTAGRVIEISYGKWAVVESAPVLFRRTKLTGELPHPHRGDLSKLWEFVLVAVEDRPLVLAWLVAALVQVDVPHPILALLAEQGSAKSTVTRVLVSLVDPSPVPLRQPPREPDGWTTAAAASWVVALDNLAGVVPAWLSDCLCRASTGDGSVKRALYTDSDVAVTAFRRCPIVNGVDLIVDRGDLAERVAVVSLPRVTTRRPEDQLTADWEAARPGVLGALLDLAAAVHERLPAVEVIDPPRMADFAKVLAAVDEVLGTRGLAHYREQSQRASVDTLDEPFIAALRASVGFVDKTGAELLDALTPLLTVQGMVWRPPRDWPKNGRAVTAQLTRHAPALRQAGWTVTNDGAHNKDNATRWTLTPPEREGKPPSPPSPTSSAQVDSQISGEVGESPSLAGNLDTSPGELDGEQASYPKAATSPDLPTLTSADEAARQARQDSGLSPLVDPPEAPPGAPTAATPGMTDRVKSALANATKPRCPCGGLAPASSTTGVCDFCSARKRAAAEAQARLDGQAS